MGGCDNTSINLMFSRVCSIIRESHLYSGLLERIRSYYGCFLNVIILSHIFDNYDLNASISSGERACGLLSWAFNLTLLIGRLGPGLWRIEGLSSDVIILILELI